MLGGYAHVQTKLEISQYREALRTACQSVHDLSHKAHEPGMKHLYEAARLLDQRCDSVARLANSQLRAMGSNNQWIKSQMGINHNPFAANRRKHKERGGTTTRSTEPNLKKNTIRKDKTRPETNSPPNTDRDERSIRVTGTDVPKFVQLRTESVLSLRIVFFFRFGSALRVVVPPLSLCFRRFTANRLWLIPI